MILNRVLIKYYFSVTSLLSMRIDECSPELIRKANADGIGSISDLIKTVIEENFLDCNCFGVVSQNKNNDNYSFSNEIKEIEGACRSDINYFEDFSIDAPTSIMYLNLGKEYLNNDFDILKENFEIGCAWYIVNVCLPERFLLILKKVIRAAAHRQSPRLLFLVDSNNYNTSIDQLILDHASDFFPDTAIILIEYSESGIFVEFKTGDWTTGESKTIASCYLKDCKTSLFNLYPSKLNQLNGKEVRFAAFHYSPYFILKPRWDGTEFRILNEFSQKFNCTLKLETDDNQWGEIFKNNTGNGVLGIVYEGKAHLGFSALYLWYNEFQYLDFSVDFIRTGITCLVPKAQLISPWLLPIQPFDQALWTVVVLTLVVATTTLYYVAKLVNKFSSTGNWRRRFKTVDDSMLRVIGMLVLQVPTAKGIKPPPSALRYVITLLEIMFLLVVASYHSGLSSVLTLHRHEKAIETVQDLVDSGLSWGATHDAWIFSIHLSTEQKTKTLLKRFKVLGGKELHERTQTHDFAFSLERLQGGYFAIGDYITEESINHLQLMKEDIYYEYCVYVLPKGSPYKAILNKLILDIQSAGLILHWEGEVVRNYLPVKVHYGVAQSSSMPTESEPIVLQLKHIHGALTILGIGLSLSTLIFLTEVFWVNSYY